MTKLLAALEAGMAWGKESVKEMITVSFLENLDREDFALVDFRQRLGPALRGQLQRLRRSSRQATAIGANILNSDAAPVRHVRWVCLTRIRTRMPLMTKEHWLVILLNEERTLALLDHDPASKVAVAGDVYRATGSGGVSATFDRLLNADGRFVGIQVWPERAHARQLLAKIPQTSYVSLSDNPPMCEVFFIDAAHERTGVESSGEQSLVGQVYISDGGRVAIGIDLTELLTSNHDYEVIKDADAKWITLS